MNDAMDTCDLNSWSAERLWAVMRDAASAPDVRVRCLDQLAFDQAPGLASFLIDELDSDPAPIGDWTHAAVAAAERLVGVSDFEAGVLCSLLLRVARHPGQAQDTTRGALVGFARFAQPQLLGALRPFLDHADPLVVQCALQCIELVLLLERYPSAMPDPLVLRALHARIQEVTRQALLQMTPHDAARGTLAANGFCAAVTLAQVAQDAGQDAALSDLEAAFIAKRWGGLLLHLVLRFSTVERTLTQRAVRCERVAALLVRLQGAEKETE